MMESHLQNAFLPWPQYGQDEADAAQQVLLSNQHNDWTGQHCHQFEQAFAKWTDSQYFIAVCNGSVALELALTALNIGEDDEVIVSPRTKAVIVVHLGGMITTNNEALYNTMWSFKDHGKSNAGALEKPAGQPPGQHFRWLHQSFGSNRRMTEMQAAIGLVQLGKVTQWHQQRLKHGALIDAVARRHKSVRAIELKPNMESAEYVHYLFVNPQGLAPG
jgi:dTDP-4-amino-4,6-dideoxygalactose transaminase